jgi:hypothetical protein
MALTLVEAAKINSGDVLRSTIIEEFARQSDILRVLPFEDISGNALKYNREEALPGIGFRGVNEAYTESVGVLNPIMEPLVIAGGDLDVDRFIVQTMGPQTRASHTLLKVKALALAVTGKFIKGDSTSDPREFDGLQVRLVGDQLVSNGSSTGAALSLGNLDAAIDAVDNPTALVMNKTMRRRLTAASRTTSVGGFITFEQDNFGRQQTRYGELPILIADEDQTGAQILPFTEAAEGGGTASTSIYVVSFADSGVTGIQNGTMDVRDLGELDEKPVFRTRVQWYPGIAIFQSKSASRLYGITNAAVVA